MMKKYMMFLIMMCLPTIAMGGALTSMVKDVETEQKLNKIIDQKLINAMARRLAQSYPDHVEELRKFIFDKKEEFNQAGDMQKTDELYAGFTKFTLLLTGKVFNEIKERELDRIQKYSQFKGRKIREDGGFMWLDRGEYLESDACHPVEGECEGKDETFECYSKMAQKWCDYPDGFEDYVVSISSNSFKKHRSSNFQTILVSRDDKANGKHYTLDVVWHNGANIGSDVGISENSLSYIECTSDYAAEQEWRNRWNQAQRNGGDLWGGYCWWHEKDDPKCKDIRSKDYPDFFPNGNNTLPSQHCSGDWFNFSTRVSSKSDKLKKGYQRRFEEEQDALLKKAGFDVGD